MNWDQYRAQLSEFLSKDTIDACHSELWSCFIHGETIRTDRKSTRLNSSH